MACPSCPNPTKVLEPVTENKTRLTPRYKVLVHDDDKTSFEFVIFMLMSIFHKKSEDALNLTLEVHNLGIALVDVLPYEQAELRVEQATSLARTNKFQIAITMEPE